MPPIPPEANSNRCPKRLCKLQIDKQIEKPLLECSWPDLGDWDYSITARACLHKSLECSWPDLGDWDFILNLLDHFESPLECSWPDLGDWDKRAITCSVDIGSSHIRMQLTRLRGLRLWDKVPSRRVAVYVLECSWPDLGDWDLFVFPYGYEWQPLECSWPDLGDWDFFLLD